MRWPLEIRLLTLIPLICLQPTFDRVDEIVSTYFSLYVCLPPLLKVGYYCSHLNCYLQFIASQIRLELNITIINMSLVILKCLYFHLLVKSYYDNRGKW